MKRLSLVLMVILGLSGTAMAANRLILLNRLAEKPQLLSGDTLPLQDGDYLRGTLGMNVRITIPDNARVHFDNVTIRPVGDGDYDWPGVTCGRATTIVLTRGNIIEGFGAGQPGISGVSLDIRGPNNGQATLDVRGNGAAPGIYMSNAIEIHGGKITATGGENAAGIGGYAGKNCPHISIYGGTITATGGEYAAGIGCGGGYHTQNQGKYIYIFGGKVTANGGEGGAGIGSGADSCRDCVNVVIKGGNVTATGGDYAAGIGSGYNGSECGAITIKSGAFVTATCGTGCSNPIGAGKDSTCGNVSIDSSDNGMSSTLSGSTRTLSPRPWDGNLSTLNFNAVATDGMTITGTLTQPYKVSIAADATVTLTKVNIVGNNNDGWAGLACNGNNSKIVIKGSNNHITAFHDDAPGIFVERGCTMSIQEPDGGHGSLVARCSTSGNGNGAGIGGGYNLDCGYINILSGTITAQGLAGSAAGIGSGADAACDGVTIDGGTVNSVGGRDGGAGIGAGANCDDAYTAYCGEVRIYGGNVTARGGNCAAGIGTGCARKIDTEVYPPTYYTVCDNIVFGGGVVNATGGEGAPGIGSGINGKCGCINFYGSGGEYRVSATCGTGCSDPVVADEISKEPGMLDNHGTPTRKFKFWDGDLAKLACDVNVHDGMVIYGTLTGNYQISIVEGVTVTLSNAVINGASDAGTYEWAGLTCLGNATFVLPKGTSSSIRTFCEGYPAIYVPDGYNWDCEGEGTLLVDGRPVPKARGVRLLADSASYGGAGIGGGYDMPGGNITIKGGNITAYGGNGAAGIGGAYDSSCGDISITGGNVTSTSGGEGAEAIGKGGGSEGTRGDVVVMDGLKTTDSGDGTLTVQQWDGNLATLDFSPTAVDGTVIYGTLPNSSKKYKISIADGATVTLSNAVIEGVNSTSYKWAGISCIGNATIILEGANTVTGFYEDYPGIHVPAGNWLCIEGTGSLEVDSNGCGAGIGGGQNIDCGFIRIDGGNITATSYGNAAGIGGGYRAKCGIIEIYGGTVIAKGGDYAAGIGLGWEGTGSATFQIFIDGGSVTATSGAGCSNPIGLGYQATGGEEEEIVVVTPGLYDVTEGSTRTVSRWDGNLATVTHDVTALNGTVIHGTLTSKHKVSIMHRATVTLSNATIDVANVWDDSSCDWAGLTCISNATIILEGVNTVKGFYSTYPGISVSKCCQLSFEGSGTLTAIGRGSGAGIGGARGESCGSVFIQLDGGVINAESQGTPGGAGIGGGVGYNMLTTCDGVYIYRGTVNATGGYGGAGIGGASNCTCNHVWIYGGIVTARGGTRAAGVGSGLGSGSHCNGIAIDDSEAYLRLVATSGDECEDPIGAGYESTRGDISIDTIGEIGGPLSDDNGVPTRTIVSTSAPGTYSDWAAANGLTGAWNAVDAYGIANVFRYAFNVPTGAFTSPPLLDIAFDAQGKVVIKTPELVNGAGFAFSIVASDDVGGTENDATYELSTDGVTQIDEQVSGSRFFRLRVVEQ